MKPYHSLLSARTAALVFAFAAACASPLTAQNQPKDPFVKEKEKNTAATTPIPGVAPKNALFLIEAFTLSQADYAAILSSPEGREKLYAQTQAAVKAGSARLDGCHLITGKPERRSVTESTDELIHPTEWVAADSKGFQYPTTYTMSQLGDHFEFEAIADGESGVYTVALNFARDQFLGMRLFKADRTLEGIPVADLFTRSSPSTCRMIPAVPALISTLHEPQTRDITLVFGTLQMFEAVAPKTLPERGAGNVVLTARIISVDRAKGWEMLRKYMSDARDCTLDLKPLLAAKQATLEHISTVSAQASTRAVHESGARYTYGTEFFTPNEGVSAQAGEGAPKAAAPSAGQAAGTYKLESRSLGFRVEVEALPLANYAFTELNLATEFVCMTGNLKDKNWSERYPELPVFSSQKITTSYTQVIGTTALVGTMNPPGNTGVNEHKDEGRMWLLFMDANME